MSIAVTLLLDAVLVIAFAALGRTSHDESVDVAGVFDTAWPFLVGLAVGWLVMLVWRRSAPVSIVSGIVIWLTTLIGGMLLRQATGDGTAVAFVIVATIMLGVFLVGWRLALFYLRRRRTRT